MGVYFVEEALSSDRKKMLCPTEEELRDELSDFGDELDKLLALPKDEFEVIMYYRCKAKVLREKNMIGHSELYSSLGFSEEFIKRLRAIIHKRFLAVRKPVYDEIKSMIPKEQKKGTTQKKV